jgi:GNAT superfamily N-acetyltransferase
MNLARVVRVASEYAASRTGARGVVHRDGSALQWLLPGVPLPFLNAASGITAPAQVERGLARFAAADADPRFTLLPEEETPEVIAALRAAGLERTGGHALLAAAVDRVGTDPAHPVARVDRSSFARFHDVDRRGFESGFPPDPARFAWWLDQPGWTLWLATVEGVDAAAGVLFTRDEVGYLAAACTVPELRRRGAHRALIAARAAEAARVGCRWIAAQAAPGSASELDLIAAGLERVAVQAVWTRP